MTHPLIDPAQTTKFGRDQTIARTVLRFASAAEVASYTTALGAAVTGAILVAGRLFEIDTADLTSAADGYWVVVSGDGYRYKSPVPDRQWDVQSCTLTVPPALTSAIWGQAWLVPAASTGAWAAQADAVAVASPRGWIFVPPRVGALVYDRSTDSYRRYSVAGSWIAGLGAPSAGAVAPESLEQAWGVIAQSRSVTAIPVIPLGVTVYIVPAGAAGDWSSRPGQIAIGRRTSSSTTWSYLAAPEGATIWCVDEGRRMRRSSGAWVVDNGGRPQIRRTISPSDLSITGGYVFAGGVAPTATNTTYAGMTISHAGGAGGNVLRIEVRGRGAGLSTVGLFIDGATSASQWTSGVPGAEWIVVFDVQLSDTASHTYAIRAAAGVTAVTTSNRVMVTQEFEVFA